MDLWTVPRPRRSSEAISRKERPAFRSRRIADASTCLSGLAIEPHRPVFAFSRQLGLAIAKADTGGWKRTSFRAKFASMFKGDFRPAPLVGCVAFCALVILCWLYPAFPNAPLRLLTLFLGLPGLLMCSVGLFSICAILSIGEAIIEHDWPRDTFKFVVAASFLVFMTLVW
jgi:hypothetical protein